MGSGRSSRPRRSRSAPSKGRESGCDHTIPPPPFTTTPPRGAQACSQGATSPPPSSDSASLHRPTKDRTSTEEKMFISRGIQEVSGGLFQKITGPGPPGPLNRGWRGEEARNPAVFGFGLASLFDPKLHSLGPETLPQTCPMRQKTRQSGKKVPCRKPRWSREPPPSAPPCWNRKGRWEEILETFQPAGRRGEGREGGGGEGQGSGAGTGIPRPTPLGSHPAARCHSVGSVGFLPNLS